MLQPTNPEFSRNLGFFSLEEQQYLNESAVVIAGAGGDGGMLAVQLARLGVGELRLADPDPFEIENINRQACCTTETIGVNKAQAVGDYIKAINPSIKVVVEQRGIQPDTIDEFMDGADLLIDETEFTMHALGVMLARKARQLDMPNLMVMNIGFGATATTFHPQGETFEQMLGISESMPIQEVAEQQIELDRWLPYLAPYIDIDMLQKVATGEKSAPSVAPGVALAASIGAVQATMNLFEGMDNNRPKPVYFGDVFAIDAMTRESRIIDNPVQSYYEYLDKIVQANQEGKAPKVSY